MAQYLHLGDLDINDRTTYWLDRLYFPPPKPKMEWLDPAHRDGQDLQAFKYDNREITFQVSVKAATEEALSTAIRNLWAELAKKNNVLEWCPQGWTDHLYFDTYLPDNIDPSEFFREFTRQQEGRHWLAMMEVKLQALPFARGDEEELIIFKQLCPNGGMEEWTGGGSPWEEAPDDWTENCGAGTLIEPQIAGLWDGTCAQFNYAGAAPCEMQTTDFIPVTASEYYHYDAFAAKYDGAPTLALYVLCYNDAGAFQGTVTVVSAIVDGTWYQHAHKNGATMGVVAPVGTGSGVDFAANTTKVKLKLANLTSGRIIYVDQVYFGCSKYAPQHRVESPVSIVVPGVDFKGDCASPADVYLDKVFWDFQDIFLGQRDRYHEDFDGVVEPTGDTTVDDNVCLTQDHEEYGVGANVLNNPGFELPGGFAQNNTDAFTNWTITRDVTEGLAYIGATSIWVHSGSWSAIWESLDGDAVAGDILSDAYAVNVALDYYLEFWLNRTVPFDFVCDVEFYNGGVYLDKKEVYAGGYSYPPVWTLCYGVVESGDFPVGTTHIKIRFYASYPGAGVRDFIVIDDVRWVQQSPMGQVDFSLEAHEGRYLPTANVSVSAATPGSSELTLSGIMLSDTLGEVGALTKESVADFGDPNTNWISVINQATRWNVVGVPSMRVSDSADKTALSQRFRMLLGTAFDPTRDFWADFFAILPIGQAVLQALTLAAVDHLIIDCRSDFRALVQSLDGTLDNAAMVEGSKWIGDLGFQADPAGVNMVLLAFWAESIYREPRPVLDVKLTYTPLYALVGDA